MAASNPAKTIAVLQSNYIPWKGYFDIIASVDEFLIFDEVQFTRRDWRNRNRIVLGGKPHWLTIPVANKGAFKTPINAIEIAGRGWARKHWSSIQHAYGRACHFHTLAPRLEGLFRQAAELTRLTQVNELFLRALSEFLGLKTTFLKTDEIPYRADDATGRLLEICQARAATTYVSGPAAKAYIDRARFAAAGVELMFANYDGYPVYEQGMAPFQHGVSMIDLLARCGTEARGHLKSVANRATFLDSS